MGVGGGGVGRAPGRGAGADGAGVFFDFHHPAVGVPGGALFVVLGIQGHGHAVVVAGAGAGAVGVRGLQDPTQGVVDGRAPLSDGGRDHVGHSGPRGPRADVAALYGTVGDAGARDRAPGVVLGLRDDLAVLGSGALLFDGAAQAVEVGPGGQAQLRIRAHVLAAHRAEADVAGGGPEAIRLRDFGAPAQGVVFRGHHGAVGIGDALDLAVHPAGRGYAVDAIVGGGGDVPLGIGHPGDEGAGGVIGRGRGVAVGVPRANEVALAVVGHAGFRVRRGAGQPAHATRQVAFGRGLGHGRRRATRGAVVVEVGAG